MSKTEDYLDSLLNSVSSGRTGMSESRSHRRMGMESIEDFENEITDVDVEAYEQRLNEADMETFVRDFEMEVDDTEDDVVDAGDGEHFFDDLDEIIKKAREKAEAKEAKESISHEENEANEDVEGSDWMDDADGIPEELLHMDDTEASEKEMPDINDDTKEFIDMLADLSGDVELSNLGKKMQNGEFGEDEETSAEPFEMDEDADKEDKPKKKEGLFKKLKKKFSLQSEDEEAEALSGADSAGEDAYANMSEEDIEILKNLEAAESADDTAVESANEKKKKKKEKKKEKKEQKKKEKKEKKELKAQKAKEAKEEKAQRPKKPKEVDLSPPLPRKPVMLICVLCISILALILLCADHVGYSVSISDAKESYEKQEYVDAYHKISGMEIKEVDADFYERVFLLAKVQKEYRSGEVLYTSGQYTKSLDSYICALGRCDANYEDAEKYGIQLEYKMLEEQIGKRMEEKFGITVDEAKELYGLYDRTEYTVRVYDIVKGLGLIEVDSEE